MIAGLKKMVMISIAFAALTAVNAQQPALYFKRLGHANGLSNNKVNCILRDKRGFTWIGTDDGLNRYDGHNFLVFKNVPGESSSVSGNTITDLHEDKDGILWIATADGGISRYDYRLSHQKQFRQYKHQPGDTNSIPVNIINALQEDKNGNLWLATSGAALLKFDKQKEKFGRLDRIGGLTMYDMVFDKSGVIWAGREGGSILKVDPLTMQWQADLRYTNFYAPLPHVVVTNLFRDSKQNIWFGSWDKAVYRYNTATGEEESFAHKKDQPLSFGTDEPIAFNEDKQGRIWIGGKYFGLYVYDPSSGHFYNYRHDPALEGSLSNNTVRCVFIDPSGEVWLGTDNGISIYHAARLHFEQQFLPPSDQSPAKALVIYDFLKKDDGSLMIGTNKGIYVKTTGGKYLQRRITYQGTELGVTRFFKDPDGSLYLGTDYTLIKYDETTGLVTPLPNTEKDQVMAKLVESRIVSIIKDTIDGHPVLLTSPYGHFFCYYDFTENRWISRRDSVKKILNRYNITDNLIRKIVKTNDGRLWFANAKNGLMLLNKNQKGSTSFMNDPSRKTSISNNSIYDIKEDTKGNLWISTYGGGLNYFDIKAQEFRHFNSVNNLFEGLETDKAGNVWSVSNGGLQRFDPITKTFTYAELPDAEKTGGVKGYIYKDAEGKMYVAGSGYFVVFDPGQVIAKQEQPKVFLTDFSIFDHSFSDLLSKKLISLRYNQNFFTIHFAAPFYSSSAPVHYSYMLEGVDKDWINAGSNTQAPYTNLSGGKYTFKVRATTTPGTWSDQITTIQIRIIPPFWKQPWFFVLLAVVTGAVVYALYRYRINEILKRQAIRNKIAQDLHDNMGSTLSSISVYSQVAKIYMEKDKQEDLRNALERIGITSSEMISEMNDIVWAINPRNDNMNTILQRMESYAKPLLQTKNISFQFNYDTSISQLHLGMEQRKNFYLIFKEAVNNTLKYAGCRHMVVLVKVNKGWIELVVEDDGKGFDVEEMKSLATRSLSGNGLNNMKRRAKDMKGDCFIISDKGKGTTVVLKFPVT